METLKEGKYIVFEEGEAIVFPHENVHIEEARKHGGNPISAGFFTFRDNKVRVFGESITLGLKSHEEDDFEVKQALGYCESCDNQKYIGVNPDSRPCPDCG